MLATRILSDLDTMMNTEAVKTEQQRNLALKQLNRIERAAKKTQVGGLSPLAVAAFLMGLVVGIVGTLLGSLVSPIFAAWGGLAGFLTGFVAFVMKTKLPHSAAANAYLLLAAYEPVYVDGYRQLQAKALDGIDATDVLRWVQDERAAIVVPKVTDLDLARRQFIDRKV